MLALPCSRGTPARVLPSLLYSGHGRRSLKHKAHQAPRCGTSGLRASQHLAPTAAGSYREKPCRAWGPHRHVCSCVGLLCKQEVRDLWALFMSNGRGNPGCLIHLRKASTWKLRVWASIPCGQDPWESVHPRAQVPRWKVTSLTCFPINIEPLFPSGPKLSQCLTQDPANIQEPCAKSECTEQVAPC